MNYKFDKRMSRSKLRINMRCLEMDLENLDLHPNHEYSEGEILGRPHFEQLKCGPWPVLF